MDQFAEVKRQLRMVRGGPAELDDSDDEEGGEKPLWKLRPMDYSPLPDVAPAWNRESLLKLEGALNDQATYNQFKVWIWRVWEESKAKGCTKGMLPFACNSLIGRFDCVVLIIGQYQGKKKPSKAKQLGKYKMVSRFVRSMIHE